jgi:arylformamidase
MHDEDDLAAREREYSPSSCIGGNYRPFVEAYFARSAVARAAAVAAGGTWLEGRYGPLPAQRLDLCLPPAPAAAGTTEGVPLLVFIHGGYWQELSAAGSLFAAARCVERGAAFAALDYTLAPQATVGGIVAECRAAMRWLVAQAGAAPARSPRIDATRIVVAGSSAGAHLAAMVALAEDAGAPAARPREPEAAAVRPRGAVLVSGIYDLRPLVGTSINTALALDEAEAARQSPALRPQAALAGFTAAETVLCWGEVETAAFEAQSRAFAAQLQAAGKRCTTFEVPARNHFDIILDLAEPGTALGRHTLELLGVA